MIPSFEIDHTKLKRGIYVSRGDGDITTYDIRVCLPNHPMDGAAAHTIEHIGADYLRARWDNIIYFGPMGCLTGFYLVVRGKPNLGAITSEVRCLFEEIANWNEQIPGATEKECGNYRFHDLDKARPTADNFLESEWEHEYPR